jgi:hypothetical protein
MRWNDRRPSKAERKWPAELTQQQPLALLVRSHDPSHDHAHVLSQPHRSLLSGVEAVERAAMRPCTSCCLLLLLAGGCLPAGHWLLPPCLPRGATMLALSRLMAMMLLFLSVPCVGEVVELPEPLTQLVGRGSSGGDGGSGTSGGGASNSGKLELETLEAPSGGIAAQQRPRLQRGVPAPPAPQPMAHSTPRREHRDRTQAFQREQQRTKEAFASKSLLQRQAIEALRHGHQEQQ